MTMTMMLGRTLLSLCNTLITTNYFNTEPELRDKRAQKRVDETFR